MLLLFFTEIWTSLSQLTNWQSTGSNKMDLRKPSLESESYIPIWPKGSAGKDEQLDNFKFPDHRNSREYRAAIYNCESNHLRIDYVIYGLSGGWYVEAKELWINPSISNEQIHILFPSNAPTLELIWYLVTVTESICCVQANIAYTSSILPWWVCTYVCIDSRHNHC